MLNIYKKQDFICFLKTMKNIDQLKNVIWKDITENMTLKELINHFFWVDLPISGGKWQNIEDPIVINITGNWVSVEYEVIGFIQQMGKKIWHREKQELIKHKGRHIDKISIVLDDDPDNYHSYYFDISNFYGNWK